MATKFNTPELQEAFNTGRELGRVEGMIGHISHVMKNLKLEYEKLYQKKQDLENSQEN